MSKKKHPMIWDPRGRLVNYKRSSCSHGSFIILWCLQAKQQGSIGVALDSNLYWPLTNSSEDLEAARTAQIFEVGW